MKSHFNFSALLGQEGHSLLHHWVSGVDVQAKWHSWEHKRGLVATAGTAP